MAETIERLEIMLGREQQEAGGSAGKYGERSLKSGTTLKEIQEDLG